jgi:uncharacterized protein
LVKIILLALGLLAVFWILRNYRRRVDRREGAPPPAGSEDMVQCVQCGVHLPRGESLTTQGRFFCSAEHQRAHQKGPQP